MPPTFTLQTVLDVRHDRVEALEIELGKLLSQLSQLKRDLRAAEDALVSIYRQLERELSGEMQLFTVMRLGVDMKQADKRINELNQAVQEADQAIQAKRQEIVQARQAEETLEILKEKERKLFIENQNRRDASFLDDLSIAQAYRQREAGA